MFFFSTVFAYTILNNLNEVIMKVSYDVASGQSSYVTGKTPQTSKEAFIIPNLDEISKTDDVQKADANKNRDFTVTDYDPFKAGEVNLPEWMQTKTTPTRSDEEILKEIEVLAKEHARTGKFQDEDPRFRELMDEYISSVSPDRESILKNSVKEINERIVMEMSGMAGTKEDPVEEARKKNGELIDYFLEAIDAKKGNRKDKEKNDTDIISSLIAARGNIASGSGMGGNNIMASRSNGYYTQVDVDHGDGKITSLVYDNQGNQMPWFTMKGDMYDRVSVQNGAVTSAFFNDSDGQIIMMYSNSNDNRDGIRPITTSTEHARCKEIQAVYNAVYDFSVGRYNPHEEIKLSSTMLTNVNGIGNTNALIKEVYDSTYERLRNEMLSSGAA
jgi:hypothetical protein